MSSIVPLIVNKRVYIYDSTSFRNEKNLPDTKKILIAKLDLDTLHIIFNKRFFKRENNTQETIELLRSQIKEKIINNNKIMSFLHDRKISMSTNIDQDIRLALNKSFYTNIDNTIINNSDDNIDNGKFIYNKIDNIDNKDIINHEKINKNEINSFEIIQETLANTKQFGLTYFFDQICENLKIKDILKTVFNDKISKILALVYYIISTEDPLMYCDDWLQTIDIDIQPNQLSSQRISELFAQISYNERILFYTLWSKLRQENEFLALDITSISSYSSLIEFIQPGYNREYDKLKQLNICMLFGETSRLPIFSLSYAGSLRDVSTLTSTLDIFDAINTKKVCLVLDKGFYSKKNINKLLDNPNKYDFMAAVPFTDNIAINFVNKYSEIVCDGNQVIAGNDTLYGKRYDINWSKNKKIYAYVYYNEELKVHSKNLLVKKANILKNIFETNNIVKDNFKDIRKYLIFNDEDLIKINRTAEINYNVINDKCKNAGWLVILSNNEYKPDKVINIYRAKDCVEKSFERMKEKLDFRRIRVHSIENSENKYFIVFLGLIILSHIDKIMAQESLYKDYTMKKMFMHLKTIIKSTINFNSIITPLTASQKRIFKLFKIPEPS
jgi:transposase